MDSSKTVPIGMPTTFPYSSGDPIWKMVSARSPMVELALVEIRAIFAPCFFAALVNASMVSVSPEPEITRNRSPSPMLGVTISPTTKTS